MPVVKGGVWTNSEDEILKASVSKYGLNQWARVSSLLARKTPKQCKARWTEWLDPGIRKIEWSKEEDEKLLHLAKLMPTQWRTIAPIVGRTATQCLERYQRLLDEAEAREERDELGLGGPAGGETSAPSADDIRKLRPGEVDPEPESRPARPDTIDLDEDEKEMLSEARARLANTQGKKAKRKERERQLEESRRLAVLQKRRELKNAGINIKIVNKKKSQMDYNADIPFEKQAAPGFYDTQEEQVINEKQREAFDPRKQQVANKRKQDTAEDSDSKRQKQEKKQPNATLEAAKRAGQMQRIREADQSSKRRSLVLPAPQVSESELEEIVKMGMHGDRATRSAGEDGPNGLVSQYSNMVGATPIRTPRTPAQEDHIANEIRNIRALTETQSSLLGGENTPLHEGAATTGFDGIKPRSNVRATPNPMATPYRHSNGVNGSVPPGATPMRTPRDNFAINADGTRSLIPSTPKDARSALRAKLASLPRPKEVEFELEELPSESELATAQAQIRAEDAAERDAREAKANVEAERLEFLRQSQVYQRKLPRARQLDYNAMIRQADSIPDPTEKLIGQETALLMAIDAKKFPLPGSKLMGQVPTTPQIEDSYIASARAAIQDELDSDRPNLASFLAAYADAADEEDAQSDLPLTFTSATPASSYASAFTQIESEILLQAEKGNKLEKKLALHLGGYQKRSSALRTKIVDTDEKLHKAKVELETYRTLQAMEDVALGRRLEGSREEVEVVSKREREAQEVFRERKEALRELEDRYGACRFAWEYRCRGQWCTLVDWWARFGEGLVGCRYHWWA